MTKTHDKVIKESNKPSLKASKKAIKKATLVLSKDEYSQLHLGVITLIEQAVDNKKMNDGLFSSIADNLIKLHGLKPSYPMYILCRDETEKALLKSRSITSVTFKNHYWKYVREFLDITKGFEMPVSKNPASVKKALARKSLTGQDGKPYSLSKISDDDLSAGLFGSKGKKALIDRQDLKIRAGNSLLKKADNKLTVLNRAWAEKEIIKDKLVMAYLKNNIIDIRTLAQKEKE